MEAARTDGTFATVTVPSAAESVRAAAAFLVQAAREMRVAAASDAVFEMAIVEALNNAVKHGNAGQQGAVIVCEMERGEHLLTVRILDQGAGFDLNAALPADTGHQDIAAIRECGYGLSIIHSVFPSVRTIVRGDRFGIEMSLTLQ